MRRRDPRQGSAGTAREVTRRTMLAGAVAWGAGCKKGGADRQQDPREAIAAAQDFIKTRLISPGTAVFGGEADTLVEELSPGKFRVRGMVDYTGLEGSTMRVPFTCVVSRVASGRWDLEEMDLR